MQFVIFSPETDLQNLRICLNSNIIAGLYLINNAKVKRGRLSGLWSKTRGAGRKEQQAKGLEAEKEDVAPWVENKNHGWSIDFA